MRLTVLILTALTPTLGVNRAEAREIPAAELAGAAHPR